MVHVEAFGGGADAGAGAAMMAAASSAYKDWHAELAL
jgi:hypothetical protein